MPPMTEDNPPTPWLEQVGSTPQDPIVPSQAFTPFHKFNAALEEDYPPEPTMPDLPISTQDLFAAVSPFGFSTVKKSARPPASNLRFSVFASPGQDTPSHGGGPPNRAKSPTPSERIPLKAKNSRVSFVGTQSERGSQSEKGSQESITPRPLKAPLMQAEVPQLDFHTSLDVLRRNSELNFTDRFLLNLEDLT